MTKLKEVIYNDKRTDPFGYPHLKENEEQYNIVFSFSEGERVGFGIDTKMTRKEVAKILMDTANGIMQCQQ